MSADATTRVSVTYEIGNGDDELRLRQVASGALALLRAGVPGNSRVAPGSRSLSIYTQIMAPPERAAEVMRALSEPEEPPVAGPAGDEVAGAAGSPLPPAAPATADLMAKMSDDIVHATGLHGPMGTRALANVLISLGWHL